MIMLKSNHSKKQFSSMFPISSDDSSCSVFRYFSPWLNAFADPPTATISLKLYFMRNFRSQPQLAIKESRLANCLAVC